MNKLVPIVSLASIAALGHGAPPKPYHSAGGFSIVPPIHWKVMDPSSTESLNDVVVQRFKMRLGSNRITLALFDPAGGSFTNNLNVVVNLSASGGDPTAADAAKYAGQLQSELQNSGLTTKTLYSKIAPFCGHHAIEAESLITMGSIKVHDLQVVIVAKGKRYIVTCSALDGTFERVRPIFLKSVKSMKIDGDARK